MQQEITANVAPLSGLVVTLDPLKLAETYAAIKAHSAIVTGELENQYLPLTVEADDLRTVHRWLESLVGVNYVDVIFCTTLSPE